MRAVLYLVLHPARLLTLAAALLGFFAYVWVAAVRAVPAVRARKAETRVRRHAARQERGRGADRG